MAEEVSRAQRQEIQTALANWLSEFGGTHFITLATNASAQSSHLAWMVGADARRVSKNMHDLLFEWDARAGRGLLGPKWAESQDRMRALCVLEHVTTNPHWHMTAVVSSHFSTTKVAEQLSEAWKKLVPSGTVDVSEITDHVRLSAYLTKETWKDTDGDRWTYLPPY